MGTVFFLFVSRKTSGNWLNNRCTRPTVLAADAAGATSDAYTRLLSTTRLLYGFTWLQKKHFHVDWLFGWKLQINRFFVWRPGCQIFILGRSWSSSRLVGQFKCEGECSYSGRNTFGRCACLRSEFLPIRFSFNCPFNGICCYVSVI